MISTAQLSMDNCSGLARGPSAASELHGEHGLSWESSQSSTRKRNLRDVVKCPEHPLPLPLEEEEEEVGWSLTDHLSSAE